MACRVPSLTKLARTLFPSKPVTTSLPATPAWAMPSRAAGRRFLGAEEAYEIGVRGQGVGDLVQGGDLVRVGVLGGDDGQLGVGGDVIFESADPADLAADGGQVRFDGDLASGQERPDHRSADGSDAADQACAADDAVEDAAELAHELGVGLLGSEKTPGTKIPMEMTSEKALIRLERMVRIFTD